LRFAPRRPSVPILHASLTPKAIEQAGRVADGWIPYYLTPPNVEAALVGVNDGLAASGRSREQFTVAPFVPALVDDDLDHARGVMRQHIAFYVAAMGDFYFQAVSRQGFEDAAQQVREEWKAGRRKEAAAAVPDELVDALTVCGPVERCRQGLAAWQAHGADLPILVLPSSLSSDEKLATIRALGPGQ
jgi:alkanesulfonate monooxygenase SsuD/methylene tetrahydromethanopterin reductase-like flavin-dependent oxidoreductase (luciferase family)